MYCLINIHRHLSNHGKEESIGVGCHYHNRYREYFDEILQCGRQIGFNSKYSTCKCEFTGKEQGCSQ